MIPWSAKKNSAKASIALKRSIISSHPTSGGKNNDSFRELHFIFIIDDEMGHDLPLLSDRSQES